MITPPTIGQTQAAQQITQTQQIAAQNGQTDEGIPGPFGFFRDFPSRPYKLIPFAGMALLGLLPGLFSGDYLGALLGAGLGAVLGIPVALITNGIAQAINLPYATGFGL